VSVPIGEMKRLIADLDRNPPPEGAPALPSRRTRIAARDR
jgi:hypothetical protein